MDFRFTDEQTAIQELARGILDREVTVERVREIEKRHDWFDEQLWTTLAEAGLLGVPLPQALGGMGFGLLELCTLLEEIGRVVAPVPALACLVLGALPLAELGTEAQQNQWLAPISAGEAVLTAALVDAAPSAAGLPGTVATRRGREWTLHGRKLLVPALHLSARCLVPAAVEGGVGIFLVDPESSGVHLTHARTSTGEPLFAMELDDARVADGELLGGRISGGTGAISGADVMSPVVWIQERAIVATCAMQVGVCERALRITAGYTGERKQFGVPIGSFQAVQHRMADGFIDLTAMRWTMWRAAWKLASGQSAAREVAVAKFWASEAAARIATSAQHLHGGMGVDVDYPVHRYFMWAKALELSLGAAAPQLAWIGKDLAQSTLQENA